MQITSSGVIALLFGVVLVGCQGKGPAAGPSADQAVEAGDGRAPAEVVPGSHEDMCAEHGVLEAACTRCHPDLIPIFKSKGDWCAEHEFPESICPTCHPERGGRPAVDVSIDEAPAHGTLIRFKTIETARQAGIETVMAIEAPDAAGVAATATLVADAAHFAAVNARSAGVVRSIRADVGTVVRRGSPLATLESAEVGQERSRLLTARARMQVAEDNDRREQELYARGISAFKQVQLARQEAEIARAEFDASSATLRMMGAGAESAGAYTLVAPIGGVVTRRAATVGTMVDPDELLFEIVDTASLWADLDVPEADAPRVLPGQKVVLRLEGLSGREFFATVQSVAPIVDPRTRTVRARARLSNDDRALRANAYARAVILTDAARTAVTVPRAAIQEARGVTLAFVRLAEDRYETRRVRLSGSTGDQVTLAGGIEPGELVATVGSFLLKTETMKEGIGAGCCEIDGPKR